MREVAGRMHACLSWSLERVRPNRYINQPVLDLDVEIAKKVRKICVQIGYLALEVPNDVEKVFGRPVQLRTQRTSRTPDNRLHDVDYLRPLGGWRLGWIMHRGREALVKRRLNEAPGNVVERLERKGSDLFIQLRLPA